MKISFLALAALSTMVALPASAETRALLVGVSTYENLDPSKHLSAPKNDVKEIAEFLTKRGVHKGNITIVADGVSETKPTRRNIMSALSALTERSRRGDFAIVYFSGHGSYQPDQPEGDPRHDEEDGYDEVFLPYDVEPTPLSANSQSIKNAIIDDELGEFADAIRDKGVDLWFILDSCYSGTGLRASGQFHEKRIEPADLGVNTARTPSPSKRVVIRTQSAASRGSEARGGYVFFSASRANEPSREIPIPGSVPVKDATWRSAFTHTLVTVMNRMPELSYGEIIDAVNRAMGEPGSRITQTAGIEGNLLDRKPLAREPAPAKTVQWPVRRDQLDAGIADGLEKGAILALYEDPNAKDEAASGYARVIETSATEAKIAPLREYPCPFVDGNPQCRTGGAEILQRARYARLVQMPLDFAFSVSAPRLSPKAPEALKARAKEVFRSLRADGLEAKGLRGRVHFADENPDFVWHVTADGFRIAPDGSDVAKLDTGAAVDLSGTETMDELQQKTLRLLLRAYRVERLRRLSAKDAETLSDQARVKVSFGVMPLVYDADLKKCTPGPKSEMKSVEGLLVAKPCSRIRINITNDGQVSRFVSLFLIDHEWNFNDICSEGGKDTTLAPRATRVCYFNYGLSQPGGSDFARYTLLVLSTPERPNVAARNYDGITNLNNADAGAARAASNPLVVDDDIVGTRDGARGTSSNPASVTMVEWDLDHRAK